MKHGPIALIRREPAGGGARAAGPGYEKVLSNLQEVKAREGKVIAVVTRGDNEVGALADEVVLIPPTSPWLQRCSRCCRCSSSPTTSPTSRAPTSTSPATWPRA